MAREKLISRKTTLSVEADIDAWLQFKGMGYSRGVSEYVCALVRADLKRATGEGAEEARRYQAYLEATGRD